MGCFKHELIGHTGRIMEDSSAEGDLNCGVLAQEGSEERNINLWHRHSGDILAKGLAAFCPCLKQSA